MAATRLFRMSRPLGPGHQRRNKSFSSSCSFSSLTSRSLKPKYSFGNGGSCGETFPVGHGQGGDIRKEVKASFSTSDSVLTSSESKKAKWVDLGLLFATVKDALLRRLNEVTRRRTWKLYVQTFIEKGIMDCRFFTLLAVAGSLLGSLLCYVEGCFLILESYCQYFHALYQGSDQGHLVQLLIEAIDMYLVATAMLVFGMGLHVLFVGSHDLLNEKSSQNPQSNIKKLPPHIGMNTIMEAKTKIGQAVVMIIQVGVLDKFKSIPLVTGFDLACFGGAVFMSAACIFLLSKLSVPTHNIAGR